MSLYLKYRPQNFNTIVGQQHVVNTLKNAIRQNILTHAYLFCGPRGTGKTSTARIIAKSLNCLNKIDEVNPCDQCENCQAVLHHQMVDLIEIDAASNRGIDEIRELREKIQFSPSQGKVKVYIIDEVHMLTKEAFNALLKTLEEPPQHAYFILATTEAHKIPETIISRCQQFSFKRITEDDIANRLSEICDLEKIESEPEGVKLIAKISEGGLRDAIGLLEQVSTEGKISYEHITKSLGITGHMTNENFYKCLTEKNIQEGLAIIEEVNNSGANISEFARSFIYYLRERMLNSIGQKNETEQIIDWIELFSKAKNQINQSLIPQMPIEIAFIKACNHEVTPINIKAIKEVPTLAEKPAPVTLETQATNQIEKSSEPQNSLKEEAETQPDIKLNDQAAEPPQLTKESPAIQIDNKNINTEIILSKWKEITNSIQTPFIKMSFMGSELSNYENNQISLKFKSRTLMEKIMEPKGKNEVKDAFKIILGIEPDIHAVVEEIGVSIQATNNSTAENNNDSKIELDNLASMAEEVFSE